MPVGVAERELQAAARAVSPDGCTLMGVHGGGVAMYGSNIVTQAQNSLPNFSRRLMAVATLACSALTSAAKRRSAASPAAASAASAASSLTLALMTASSTAFARERTL